MSSAPSNWEYCTSSIRPGFLSEYFLGSSFSISWIVSDFPPIWHLNSKLGPFGGLVLPPGSSFFSQRLYWALAASSCSCCSRSPGDQQHNNRFNVFTVCISNKFTRWENDIALGGWVNTTDTFCSLLLSLKLLSVQMYSSGLCGSVFTQQQRLTLAQMFTIWSFDQNISILAFNTEKNFTAHTVIRKKYILGCC